MKRSNSGTKKRRESVFHTRDKKWQKKMSITEHFKGTQEMKTCRQIKNNANKEARKTS
jgi:hypothetical protein